MRLCCWLWHEHVQSVCKTQTTGSGMAEVSAGSRGMLRERGGAGGGTLGRGVSALGLSSFHGEGTVTWSISCHFLHCAVGQGMAGT